MWYIPFVALCQSPTNKKYFNQHIWLIDMYVDFQMLSFIKWFRSQFGGYRYKVMCQTSFGFYFHLWLGNKFWILFPFMIRTKLIFVIDNEFLINIYTYSKFDMFFTSYTTKSSKAKKTTFNLPGERWCWRWISVLSKWFWFSPSWSLHLVSRYAFLSCTHFLFVYFF